MPLLLTAVCQPVIFLVGPKKGVFMTLPDLDQAKAEQFAERMVSVLNEGAIALLKPNRFYALMGKRTCREDLGSWLLVE